MRLLVNGADGSALMKHVGPRSGESFVGAGIHIGEQPQDEYRDFMDHARSTGAPVWAVNVRSGRSMLSLIDAPDIDAGVLELPEIQVPLGMGKAWAGAYSPRTAEFIVRTTSATGETIYEKSQLPHIPGGPDETSAASLMQTVERRRSLRSSVRHLGRMSWNSSEGMQRFDQARAAIAAGATLLPELARKEYKDATTQWVEGFLSQVDDGAEAGDNSPAMQAFALLVDVGAGMQVGQETIQLKRARAVGDFVDEMARRISWLESDGLANANAYAIVGWLDAEIGFLHAQQDEQGTLAYFERLRTKLIRSLRLAEELTSSPAPKRRFSKAEPLW